MISPSMLRSQPRYLLMHPPGTYHTPTPKRRRNAGKTLLLYKADWKDRGQGKQQTNAFIRMRSPAEEHP